MDGEQKHIYSHEAQILPPSISHQATTYQAPSHVSNNGFPVLAIAALGIMATIFLLVSYYILVTKCCFRWQQLDPLRRFSFRRTHQNEDPWMAYSPSLQLHQHRGLDDMLIREIPTFKYSRTEGEGSSMFKCVVCLNEFQDQDMLRLLPKCSHAFHLDCIDIWLQSNANCPLCRTSILGITRDPLDTIVAPNSSPQYPQPFIRSPAGSNEDFVVIEVSGDEGTRRLLQRQQDRSDSSRHSVHSRSQSSRKSEQKLGNVKSRKFHRVSIMGDECINVREKDDQFSIQPIRRSFSMDSAADRHVYLSIQEVIRQNGHRIEVRTNDECSSRSQRSIFSFGPGRGSKRAVLPVDQL